MNMRFDKCQTSMIIPKVIPAIEFRNKIIKLPYVYCLLSLLLPEDLFEGLQYYTSHKI